VQMAPAIGKDEAELGGQADSITPAPQGLPDKPLVGSVRIRVSSVEKEHSELERPVDGGHRAGPGTGTVDVGHGHAAEPQGGHLQPPRAEVTSGDGDRHSPPAIAMRLLNYYVTA